MTVAELITELMKLRLGPNEEIFVARSDYLSRIQDVRQEDFTGRTVLVTSEAGWVHKDRIWSQL